MNQSATIFLLKWDAAQIGGCFVPQLKVPDEEWQNLTRSLTFLPLI